MPSPFQCLPIALTLFLCAPAIAQTAATADETSLAQRFEAACRALEKERIDHNVPGMSLAVVADGKIFTRGFGVADRETGRKVDERTLFAIASTSKSFTALLAACQEEAGLLDLDDTVRKHIPHFTLKDETATKEATIRDLLSHRTGLTRTDLLMGGTELTIDDVVRQLAHAELLAPFRTRFLYNNQMFLVAGLASSAVEKASWPELIQSRILAPLDMSDSTADLDRALADKKLSHGYKWDEDEEAHEDVPNRGIRLSLPAGGIYSNARDMAKYVACLLNETHYEGGTLISKERLEDLWTSQIATGPESGYGLGWMTGKRGEDRMVDHGGNIDGFTAMLALLPDRGIGFALLTNLQFSALQSESKDVVFGAMLGETTETPEETSEEEAAPFNKEQLRAYEGTYHLEVADQIWTVAVNDDGRLTLDIPQQMAYVLHWPNEENRWVFEVTAEVAVSFEIEEGQNAKSLTLFQSGVELNLPRHKGDDGLPTVDELMAAMTAHVPENMLEMFHRTQAKGTMTMVHQGLVGKMEMFAEGLDRLAIRVDLGKFGFLDSVIDGDKGWSDNPIEGYKELDARELEDALKQHPMAEYRDWREIFESITILSKTDLDGQECLKIRVKPTHGELITRYIDMERGLVLRDETSQPLGEIGAIPIKITYGDFREVHGVEMAHRVEISNPFTGRTVIQIDGLELAKEIPTSAFERR